MDTPMKTFVGQTRSRTGIVTTGPPIFSVTESR